MEHLERVREEFARQAETFAASPAVGEAALTERFVQAMAPAAGGALLDVACGPGILTVALAATAREIVAFDLTPEMLEKARRRCAEAGRANASFQEGDATHLPFGSETFDGAVTRLSVHHFQQPERVLGEIFRVLRPGGLFVLGDVISSEDPGDSDLHNAIEVLRDPSHTRMLPASALLALIERSGFVIVRQATWDRPRRFDEWMGIANDPTRVAPLRTLLSALARAGQTVGIGLSIEGGELTFFHRWQLVEARKPPTV
ncbi:MAG: class I SAM-dependent methyltransferase [Acetobacteraceae bacterium]